MKHSCFDIQFCWQVSMEYNNKRKYEYHITLQDIENVPKLNIPIFDSDENSYLQLMCKYVLFHAKYTNHDNEVGLVLDTFGKEKPRWSFGTSNNVRFSFLNSKLCYKWDLNRYIVLHNHPSNNAFSWKDLRSFITSRKVLMVLAIQNNGVVNILYKLRITSRNDYNWIKHNYASMKDFLDMINIINIGLVYLKED